MNNKLLQRVRSHYHINLIHGMAILPYIYIFTAISLRMGLPKSGRIQLNAVNKKDCLWIKLC